MKPAIDAPQPQELAEHLARLRRGEEIALLAQGILRRVIAAKRIEQRHGHELRDRQRTVERNGARDALTQRRHAVCRGFSAYQKRAAAVSHMGMLNAMPRLKEP